MKGRVVGVGTGDWRVFRCHHPIWPGVDSDRLSDIICDLLEPLQPPPLLPRRTSPKSDSVDLARRRSDKASSTFVRSLPGDKDLVCEMMSLLGTNLSHILEIRDVFVL